MSVVFLVSLALCSSAIARDSLDGPWRLKVDTKKFGPLEAVVRAQTSDSRVILRADSEAQSVLRTLPKYDGKLSIFVASLIKEDGNLVGKLEDGSRIALRFENERLSGKIEGGILAGRFEAERSHASKQPMRDYPAIVDSFEALVRRRIYDPAVLRDPEWKSLITRMHEVAQVAQNDIDMVLAFAYTYQNKPFSHLSFRRSQSSAAEMIAYFDTIRVGGDPVALTFKDQVAILRVSTMTGLDTMELIENAYVEIANKNPRALVIDLRENGGGAFAAKPLVEHVIVRPLDAGFFVTNNWTSRNSREPGAADVSTVRPWQGYSIKSWWKDIETEPIIRLRFEPASPTFTGKVYVLVSGKTASAAELATDAFRSSGRAVLVGENTAGEMLSQSPFDVRDGFQSFIPVANYYSAKNGRIEGKGVPVDHSVPSAQAEDKALSLIRSN